MLSPEPRRFSVVLLGASKFPYMDDLDNPAFRASKDAIAAVLTSDYLLGARVEQLDLFDKELRVDEVIREIRAFIAEAADPTDLIFYYCGHGTIQSPETLCLILRSSREGQTTTTLRIPDFQHDLQNELLGRRTYVLLDCCFAAAAVRHLQSGRVADVVADQVEVHGTTVFAATSKKNRAIAPKEMSTTLFTWHLSNAIRSGIENADRELSLAVLAEHVNQQILREPSMNKVMPELHIPRRSGGNPSLVPLFRNKASPKRRRAKKPPPSPLADEVSVVMPDKPLPVIEPPQRTDDKRAKGEAKTAEDDAGRPIQHVFKAEFDKHFHTERKNLEAHPEQEKLLYEAAGVVVCWLAILGMLLFGFPGGGAPVLVLLVVVSIALAVDIVRRLSKPK